MSETISPFRGLGNNCKVKVYLLNDQGQWDDCGTGNLSITKKINEKIEIEEEYFKVISTDN